MSSITLLSPAKINLTLNVLEKRPDGYHEIRSIMQPVNLFDEIKIEVTEGEGIEIESKGVSVPTGRENLAWKAAYLFLKSSGISLNIRISIEKRIPVGAGLGGGSGNAAAVLVGINRITNKFAEDELVKLSPQVGADVAFFIRCRTALVRGIGEGVTHIKDFPLFHYVLLNPGFQIETKKIYELWDVLESRKNPSSELSEGAIQGRAENIVSLFRKGKLPLRNDLERAVATLYPDISSLKERLLAIGAEAASMTGSGSTVFGVFEDEKRAKIAYDYLKDSSTFKAFLVQGISGWHRL